MKNEETSDLILAIACFGIIAIAVSQFVKQSNNVEVRKEEAKNAKIQEEENSEIIKVESTRIINGPNAGARIYWISDVNDEWNFWLDKFNEEVPPAFKKKLGITRTRGR